VEGRKGWRRILGWRVDREATMDDLTADPHAPLRPADGGGRMVYVDEHGQRRRLPANLDELTPQQRDAVIAALSQELGAAPPDEAKMVAIERLTELRAAGRISEEHYKRERRRLEEY
jgi:hypothetical protein